MRYGTATHTPLDRYFETRFAAPMQFSDNAMWLMPPPANEAYMAGGDYLRPRDFLKFGQLMLDRGRWHGRRIVGADWLAQSIIPRTAPEGDRYGYGWHLTKVAVDGRSRQLFIVLPSLDAAVMVTAGNYNQFPVWRKFLPEVVTTVVRACESTSAR